MVPHLVRAQSTYKDIRLHTHTHTDVYTPPPHTLQIHALLVMDW